MHMTHKLTSDNPSTCMRLRLAAAAVLLSVLLLTMVGAWVEARWPNPAGRYIAVTPREAADTTSVLWRLVRVDGVQDAVAVLQGDLPLDETRVIPWSRVLFYADQTGRPAGAFLPPDPTLKLWQGCLPAPQSLDEVLLSYELAQMLQRRVGERVAISGRDLQVVGIWSPSARLPGSWAQVSAEAAEAISPSAARRPHHWLVLPEAGRDVVQVAASIWRALPEVEVLSPAWELGRARQERAALFLALSGAALLALLVSLPLLSDVPPAARTATWIVPLLAGSGGLVAGWLLTLLANGYARQTLGLTPLSVTPRLAVFLLVACAGMGLLGKSRTVRWPWPARYAAAVAALALCATAMVVVGTLREALDLSLNEAQRTATDWVSVPGVPASGDMLRVVYRLPGIRGYALEARGGPVNEDETRWLGPWPASGVLYGMQWVGSDASGSTSYRVGYWRGRPLKEGSLDEAVVGYDLAREQGWQVGDRIEVRGVALVLVGIREHLQHDPRSDVNHRVEVSLAALQRVLRDPGISGQVTLLIPPARDQQEKAIFLREVSNRLGVPAVTTIADRLAQIACGYPGVWTLAPADAQGSVQHASATYANLTTLCNLFFLTCIALTVTSTFSRRLMDEERQIGLLRAFGTDEGSVLGQYLQKATLLGVASALVGILCGWALARVLNGLGPAQSVELLFTPGLGAGVCFAMVLVTVLAAAGPATRAARQSVSPILFTGSGAQPEARLQSVPPEAGLLVTAQATRGGEES